MSGSINSQAGGRAKRLERRTLYRGSFLEMTQERVELPNQVTVDLELVRHPGAAAVVPLGADGQVVLLRQYRHATDGWLVEVPAGKLDAGEAPDVCARRELAEEAGLAADDLVPLGPFWASPGFTDEVIHLFLARGLNPTEQQLEADELLHTFKLPLAEAVALAARGEIADGKSACALLRAAWFLGLPPEPASPSSNPSQKSRQP
ncbi:MAG TPA: NUDIX hydrolase [Thermoanaerobaculia bacterium]|nr:NUDIX hydrolase [Thermoanaerobaculia bacterium]